MRLLIVLFSLTIISCDFLTENNKLETYFTSAENQEDLKERGEYLVLILGCGDCHTPKIKTDIGMVPDNNKFLSGHATYKIFDVKLDGSDYLISNRNNTAFKGPWGVTFAPNITPDPTGIGYWSFDRFKSALKEGKSYDKNGVRVILPPMPWQNYKNMTDEDVKSIYVYLKSIKSIKNVVPDAAPGYLR